jgi:GR25 family glycosyltransferase involved in LPS biosynthesis
LEENKLNTVKYIIIYYFYLEMEILNNNKNDDNSLTSISDIKHAVYINLDHRTDRKTHVEQQLALIGITSPTRFNAIKLPNGAIGCSMSHLKCLQIAKEQGWPHLLLCEDDIEFLEPTIFVNQLNGFLKNSEGNSHWDVVLIAGNNTPPYGIGNDYSVRVFQCQTTTGYLVKKHYYDTLISNIKEGIEKLMRDPQNHRFYAIDKYWFKLQQQDYWFLIIPLTVVQREDYSDIEKRQTNYKKAMIDLDKESYFRRVSK